MSAASEFQRIESSRCHLHSQIPIYPAASQIVHVRGLPHHLLVWGDLAQISADQPLLLLAHGWMDVGASFQFLVDELRLQPGWAQRPIVAFDWRGFGQTPAPEACDTYHFADYLGDLDGLIDQLSPDHPIDLLGHSMGGNIVMMYAGIRPEKIRKLVNLEGFGLAANEPEEAPQRYAKWLNELKGAAVLKDYDSQDAVAKRLLSNNPRMRADRAQWLAQYWGREQEGRWVIQADPAHKRSHPMLYRVEEILALWRRIACPVLMVEGLETLYFHAFQQRYTREMFLKRLANVSQYRLIGLADAGHMLHHDQPEALAIHLAEHLSAPKSVTP